MSLFITTLSTFFAGAAFSIPDTRQTSSSLASPPPQFPAYPLAVSCNPYVDFNTSYTLLSTIETSSSLSACASLDGSCADLNSTLVEPYNNKTYQICGSNDKSETDAYLANTAAVNTLWTTSLGSIQRGLMQQPGARMLGMIQSEPLHWSFNSSALHLLAVRYWPAGALILGQAPEYSSKICVEVSSFMTCFKEH